MRPSARFAGLEHLADTHQPGGYGQQSCTPHVPQRCISLGYRIRRARLPTPALDGIAALRLRPPNDHDAEGPGECFLKSITPFLGGPQLDITKDLGSAPLDLLDQAPDSVLTLCEQLRKTSSAGIDRLSLITGHKNQDRVTAVSSLFAEFRTKPSESCLASHSIGLAARTEPKGDSKLLIVCGLHNRLIQLRRRDGTSHRINFVPATEDL